MTELTHKLKEKLSHVKLVAFDCDGTLWVGDNPLGGAESIIDRLRSFGINVVAITNNSTRSRENLAEKATKLGLNLKPVDFYATNYLAADYVAEKYPGGRILVIGSSDLVNLISLKSVTVLRPERDYNSVRNVDWTQTQFDAVVVGLSVHVTYSELCQAVVALQNGAGYIATNTDYTFPAAGGYLLPGSGSFVDLIARVSGVEPVVLGKPEPLLIQAAMQDSNVSADETLIVGDRIETDILCGINAGTLTCQVMTGVAESDMKNGVEPDVKADFICKDLVELESIFRDVFGGRSQVGTQK
jgi:4-nitrophenyl phosphatase